MHVRNANVTGERAEIRAYRPYVDVMNFLNAVDAEDRARHGLELNALGQAFEQNVSGLA